MEPTFESIKSLIVSETWEGNQVKVKFKAHNQTDPIESMGIAMPSQEEIQKRIAIEMAKSTASSMAVNTGANALGKLTGIGGMGNAIGSAASNAGVGYQMDPAKLMHVDLTDQVKQDTILNAFRALTMYYQFENNAWSYKAPVA
jgi:hypothetical protein